MSKNRTPQLVKDDPWLDPYKDEITDRISRYRGLLADIKAAHKSLKSFSNAYKDLGIHYSKKDKCWIYREWAPQAHRLSLIGSFNNWNRDSHVMTRIDKGIWEICVSKNELTEGDLVKVHVASNNGAHDRIPAYIFRVVQDNRTHDFSGQVWNIEKKFEWTDQTFDLNGINNSPIIYEAHVGMAQEREGVGNFVEFAENILPRIKDYGYNTIQLMAIQEHPYYGSFGYHVSNFFSVSSRFGTPEEFKFLVNKAHELGIAVIIDLVHSHAVKNFAEGLNDFDGSGHQYFHKGGRGYHNQWDSKLFDYGKREVLQFLLSNVRYWIDQYHVDGFRFDGITSMLYHHHGDFVNFDHYDKYFVEGVDWDALKYLQLANELVHQIKPDAITIAEDMSGMPGLCRKVKEGGIGFDFRLGMGIPDFWIKYLKEKKDENWNIHELWSVMTNRRFSERTVAYAESHDQAIVGDKTLAFWLMDKEMYYHMQVDDRNLVIDRGMALHKMIRLFTAVLGGEAYLNFIGNEFGHPEWIDFPREGNNWSYKYARRQWSLADDENLKYKYLAEFDKRMISMLKKYDLLSSMPARQVNMDESNKVIVFERNNLIFAFNFHHERSISDYKFTSIGKGKYDIVLSTDDAETGGFSRIDTNVEHFTLENDLLSIYLPSRTALVLKRE
ncbi:MAG: alpha amylase C-terminal domain-containing protein [Cytophagales bacterium]|nr:alpha amylase C-terminal domain-containing protein [Cytophagales bacterium]